jgi:hypothetical protein
MDTTRYRRTSCFTYIPRVGLLKLVLERRGLRASHHDLPTVDHEKLVHSRTSRRDFLRRCYCRRLQLPRDQETEPIQGADAVGADQLNIRQPQNVSIEYRIAWVICESWAIIVWPFAFWGLYHTTVLQKANKRVWFWVVLLTPVSSSVAYWSTKRNVTKYSRPDPFRLKLYRACGD